MQNPFDHFSTFLFAVCDHLFTLLAGCVVTVILNYIEKYTPLKGKMTWKADAYIVMMFLFFACFQAWHDQYNRAKSLDHPLPLPSITVNVPPAPPVQVVIKPSESTPKAKSTDKPYTPPKDSKTPLANVHIVYQKRVPSADPDMPFGIEVLITTDAEITPFALDLIFTGDVGKFVASGPTGMYLEQQGGIRVASPNIIFLQRKYPGFTPEAPITVTAYSKTYIELKNISSLPFHFALPADALKN